MGEHDAESFPISFESLRWFMLLEATRWTHLPVTGGWHEQHPMFVDEIMILFEEKGKADRIKRKREEAEMDPEGAMRRSALNTGVPYVH